MSNDDNATIDTSFGGGEKLANDHVVLLLIGYSAVILVGVIGNLTLLAALLSNGAARLRTPQLLSVCAADLLVCGISAPLTAASLIPPHPLSHFDPIFRDFIQIFPVTASTFHLTLVAIDRYITVLRPIFLRRACRYPIFTVFCTWIDVTTCSLAFAFAKHKNSTPWFVVKILYIVFVFFAPMIIIAACHLSVRKRLTALSLTARAAHGELPLPVPLIRRPSHVIIVAGLGVPRERRDAFDAGDGRPDKRRRKTPQPSLLGPQPLTSTLRSRRRLANVLIGVATMFAACWCPHMLTQFFLLLGANLPEALRHYALLLGHSHSALHATAYWALNKNALSAACAAWKIPDAFRAREERPSSTNEAALGAFHPRFARPAPAPRPPPSSYLF